MNIPNTTKSGWDTIAGAVLLSVSGVLFDVSRFGEPDVNLALAQGAQVIFIASTLALINGVRTIAALQSATGGGAAKIGTMMTYAGFAASTLGSLLSIANPIQLQWLNPIGSVAISTGMIVLGSATIRDRALPGAARWLPLIVGIWFFGHMPFQFAFFASPSGIPSHTLMCGGWAVLWALIGATLVQQRHTNLAMQ